MNSKVVVSYEITKQRSEREAEGIEKAKVFSSNNGQLRTINISYQKGDCAGNMRARSWANMKKNGCLCSVYVSNMRVFPGHGVARYTCHTRLQLPKLKTYSKESILHLNQKIHWKKKWNGARAIALWRTHSQSTVFCSFDWKDDYCWMWLLRG